MPNLIDRSGQRYGKLVVLDRVKRPGTYWRCQCDCGRIVEISSVNIKATKACKSCSHIKHGGFKSPEYAAWKHMRQRCLNDWNASFHLYGGRGISVCERWVKSFAAFFEDMGPKPFPAATLGRIDNDGNYTPENCAWQTPEEQSQNTRRTRLLTYQGKTQSVRKWSREVGIHHNTIFKRLNHGWSVPDALSIPPGSFPRYGSREIPYHSMPSSTPAEGSLVQ